MAKAGRKSTPSKNARRADAEQRYPVLRPRSPEDWAAAEQRLRDAGWWVPTPENLAEADKARKVLDRAAAIEAGYIAPPWMKKKAEGPKVARVKQVLPEVFPPNGRPPRDMPEKAIRELIDAAFDKRGWPHAKRDVIARAAGRRR
jgi:hypothetical protein